MPCTKCEEGNYKWGKTGECEYPTKEACESANSKYSKMKPTPLGKKTYEEYEKELKEFNLSKVEKVQLGLVDDLNKMTSKMIPLQKKAQTFIGKIESQGGQLQKTINALKGTLKQALKIQQDGYDYLDPSKKMLEKIETQAKELGINPNEIKGYKEAKKVRSEAYYDYKGLADAYWENISGLGDDVNALKSIAPL
jgi:hypothetical protein